MYANTAEKAIEPNQNEFFFRLLGMIVCAGAAASVLTTALSVHALEILPLKYFLIVFLVDAGLVAVPFWLFGSGKTAHGIIPRIAAYAIAALMLCVNLLAASTLGETSDLLESQYTTGGGYIEYSIVAQRMAGVELSTQLGKQNTVVC